MPILRSAIKKLRQDRKRTQHNRAVKTTLKHALDRVVSKPTAKDLSSAFSLLDRAAKRHLIHPNKAARLKSQLARRPTS
ncbi:MAG: 30S ribosomal protein S20 [bacterium]|nr:30S ribosomal protein S20 [bacterium]